MEHDDNLASDGVCWHIEGVLITAYGFHFVITPGICVRMGVEGCIMIQMMAKGGS